MRIRAIKPEFFFDEELASLPPLTRLLYIGLWCEADDEGRLRLHPMYLRGKLFPYSSEDLQPHIDSLKSHGKLIEYSVKAQTYGFLPNFNTHQRINRPSKSKLPEPPTNVALKALTESSVNTHGGLTIGKERKGKQSAPACAREVCSSSRELLDEWNKLSGQSRKLKAFDRRVSPRLGDGFSKADVLCVIRWVFASEHKSAHYLRENGYARPETVFRASKFESYLELAKLGGDLLSVVSQRNNDGPQPLIEYADGEKVWG